jgi:hypothetical protein
LAPLDDLCTGAIELLDATGDLFALELSGSHGRQRRGVLLLGSGERLGGAAELQVEGAVT